MHSTKEKKTAKGKTTTHHTASHPMKDLRPEKDAKAGGQKKEDPTITAPPPPNIIAI